MPINELNFLSGRLDAVELLTAALAAQLSPAIAGVLLARCKELREKVAQGGALSDFEQGFLSTEGTVLQCLRQVSDAEKIRSVSGTAQH